MIGSWLNRFHLNCCIHWFRIHRDPDDIKALVKAFNKDRAMDYLQKTKRVLKWLKKDERLKK